MPRRHPKDQLRPSAAAGATLALSLLLMHDSAIAEANLSVEATAGYTDNLLRTPDGDEDFPFALGFTGTWIESTRRLSADVEGRVNGVTYLNGSFDDEVVGQLDGSVTFWAVPERFAWVLENVYGQITTDPFSPISPENRQNTNVLSTGPDWFIPLGERTRAYLGGRYSSVQYEVTDDEDSERLLGIAGVDRFISSSSRLGLQAAIETVDFDSVLQSDFDRKEAYIQYEQSRGPELDLAVNAGYTWLSSDEGDRSRPMIDVQLSRRVSSSVKLQLHLVSRFSDAGSIFATGGSFPDSLPSAAPGVIPEGGVFEERGGSGVLTFQRARTMLSFAIGVADELYETGNLDRRRYDAMMTAERRMTPRMTASADISWSRNEYQSAELDQEDTDTEYQLQVIRELGQRMSLACVGLYAARSSDRPLGGYHETQAYLVLNYSLR
jgi:hypothetical protein